MAKELTISLSISFNKDGLATSMQTGVVQYDVAGSDYSKNTMTVPTDLTDLPLGSVGTPGYCMIQNRDTANFVDVWGNDTPASSDPCVRLKPGEAAIFRFASAAPAAKADTAPVKIEYLIIAD